MLAEFASVVDAVECAVSLQRTLAERNALLPEDAHFQVRIGINLGDVIVEGDDRYGDGVNVATRVEGLAEPGGICITDTVERQLGGKTALVFVDAGEHELKNIARPVRIWRWATSPEPKPEVAPQPLPNKPSIAVLPFDNLSADPEQEYFVDGMVEEINTALSRNHWLFVIARNSSATYKGKMVDVRTVGHELGVRYLLKGSVRTDGERIRVTAQLIETIGSSHLWADRYDRPLKDVFAIQDEITTAIVGRIGPELLAAEHARVSRKPTRSLDAWECVIRALYHASQQSESESGRALALLDKALDHDPNYAQALGMKAWLIVFRAFQGWEDMGAALEQAETLIARSVAADSEEPWSYLAQGMVADAIRDNRLAMTAFTRAVALNPNFIIAHCQLGIAHALGGRWTEALACIDYGMRLSPREVGLTDFQLYYAFAYFQGAQYELGLQYAQQAHRMRPGHVYPLLFATTCAGHLGRKEVAAVLIRDLKTVLPTISTDFVDATCPYVQAEDRARFIEGLRRAGLE